ncbi:MAG: MotA/TolQ/ExbB proton channel family protein [Methanobacterium sp.]
MATSIPGSEYLSSALHVVAQSLLLPVMVILLGILIYSIIQVGGLLSEHSSRIRTDSNEVERIIKGITNSGTPEKIKDSIETAKIPQNHKEILKKIASNYEMGEKSRESLARKLIDEEEIRSAKRIEKTDIIAKIAPAVGLMGTLIPLGPGLAALGSGDINTLSQQLTIAFDAAITGMAAASIAFTVSRIRRRWYEDQLSTLETLAESLLEVLENVKTKTEKTIIFGTGN